MPSPSTAVERGKCHAARSRTNSSILIFVLPVFGPSTCLEVVIGLHLAVEVSVVECAIANVIATDRNIND